jgi:hypothetical protein
MCRPSFFRMLNRGDINTEECKRPHNSLIWTRPYFVFMSSLTEKLLELEKKLLDPDLRRTPEKLAPLLANDFMEFGSSGHAYDRQRILFLLRRQIPARLVIEEFRVFEVSASAALVTYRACPESTHMSAYRYSLRSSLWMLRGDAWQMVFHQGTNVPELR